jgi:hypothetical protein
MILLFSFYLLFILYLIFFCLSFWNEFCLYKLPKNSDLIVRDIGFCLLFSIIIMERPLIKEVEFK